MTRPAENQQTVEALAIAEDVLANRRSHDVCDRGECFYPTVIQLAQGVSDLAALARRVAELEAELREIVDRHMRPCGVHEVPLPCDVALAETYAIAAEALDVQEGGV